MSLSGRRVQQQTHVFGSVSQVRKHQIASIVGNKVHTCSVESEKVFRPFWDVRYQR